MPPRVREFFPSTLTLEESDSQTREMMELFAEQGWGWCAVELKTTGDFIFSFCERRKRNQERGSNGLGKSLLKMAKRGKICFEMKRK